MRSSTYVQAFDKKEGLFFKAFKGLWSFKSCLKWAENYAFPLPFFVAYTSNNRFLKVHKVYGFQEGLSVVVFDSEEWKRKGYDAKLFHLELS